MQSARWAKLIPNPAAQRKGLATAALQIFLLKSPVALWFQTAHAGLSHVPQMLNVGVKCCCSVYLACERCERARVAPAVPTCATAAEYLPINKPSCSGTHLTSPASAQVGKQLYFIDQRVSRASKLVTHPTGVTSIPRIRAKCRRGYFVPDGLEEEMCEDRD